MTKHKIQEEGSKVVEVAESLAPGEIKVVARVKMLLNGGRLSANPGDVVILGDSDRNQGVNIDLLLRNRSVVPYESEEQAAEIKAEWEKRRR